MTPTERCAVVTGGASGLGFAAGQALALAGARVALLDLDPAKVKKATVEIGGLWIACDTPMLNGEVIRLDSGVRLQAR